MYAIEKLAHPRFWWEGGQKYGGKSTTGAPWAVHEPLLALARGPPGIQNDSGLGEGWLKAFWHMGHRKE